MLQKSKQPSKTEIGRQAKACLFNPRVPGPLQVIADTNNVQYYEERAKECISQYHETPEEKIHQLQMAVALLLLSLAKRNGKHPQDQ